MEKSIVGADTEGINNMVTRYVRMVKRPHLTWWDGSISYDNVQLSQVNWRFYGGAVLKFVPQRS